MATDTEPTKMAGTEFKVGDKVRIKYCGKHATVTKVPTEAAVILVVDGDSTPLYYGTCALDLVEPTIEVGDKVLVAYEGTVTHVGSSTYEVTTPLAASSSRYSYVRPEHTTLVSKAEPEYVPGKLYRDTDSRLYYRTESGAWRWLSPTGYAIITEAPALPMREVTAG